MSIHPSAVVSRHAEIDPSAEIGPFCVIDEHVRIAAGCKLHHGVYITGWTEVEADCEIHPGAIVGHTPQDTKYTGARSFCRVGRGTVLREYVTVHRGTMPESETVIGADCFLLAGSHVAHNCRLADHVTLINNVLLAGHVQVGPRVTMGGASVAHQFVRIGELAMIAGVGRAIMDVPPFALIERGGRVAGLNRLGMRRAGMPREEIEDIRFAYRILYRGRSFSTSVAELPGAVSTPAGRRLVEFLQQESKRGIAGRARRRSPEGGDGIAG